MWEKASDIMTRDIVSLNPQTSAIDAAELFSIHPQFESIPVVDETRVLLGFFTKSTLCKLIAEGADIRIPVQKHLTTEFVSVREDISIKDLLNIDVWQLAVTGENGVFKGVISRTDLMLVFRKKTQAMLNRMQIVVDSTYNGIIAINEENRIILMNKAAAEFTGWDKNDAINKDIEQVIPETGLPDVTRTGQPVFGQKVNINGYKVVSNRSPIYEGDRLIGAVGVFQDISALETVSQELEHTQNLNKELNAIIDSCHDAIVVADAQGNLERINKSYERISGIDRDSILGKNMTELEEEGIVSQSISLLVLQEKEPVTILQKLKTGREIFFTGTPVRDEHGNIIKVVSTGRDLTELNNLRAELERTKELSNKYYHELKQLKEQLGEQKKVIFSSEKMQNVAQLALKIAQVDSTVLVLGESGVGKELIARIVHSSSKRKNNPFVTINCGAIPEHLLESELFGYEEGAFTGAKKGGKTGLFEEAHQGTIFLDEIGELPLNLQVKLLRVLQEEEITPVGGVKPKKIDVRVIAATNAKLDKLVADKLFREDLYYRLNVVPVEVPPLRERKEDIIPLTFHFLKKFNRKYSLNKRVAPEVLDELIVYEWPGNVRELENIIERMMVTSNHDMINHDDLPALLRKEREGHGLISIAKIMPLKDAVQMVEQILINRALKEYGSTRKAAKVLGINQSTVARKKNMD
ncbi:MAG: sigma 54-interacting transcriptional regulator [Bacillota bacterium]